MKPSAKYSIQVDSFQENSNKVKNKNENPIKDGSNIVNINQTKTPNQNNEMNTSIANFNAKVEEILNSHNKNNNKNPESVQKNEHLKLPIINNGNNLSSNGKRRDSFLDANSKINFDTSLKFNQNKTNQNATNHQFVSKNVGDDNRSIYSATKKNDLNNTRRNNSTRNGGNSVIEKSVKSKDDTFDAGFPGKGSLKEILENVNKESKFYNIIEETMDFFNGEKFYMNNIREDKDKFEMIEKIKYQKMKENNLEYKQKKIQLTEIYNKMVKDLNETTNSIIKLKQSFNEQEKSKENNKNDIYNQENELKQTNIENEKVHEMILENRMKMQNAVKSLMQINKKYANKIPKSLKILFDGFIEKNSDDYLELNRTEKIKNLKEKIIKLEEQVKLKNKEFDNIKNIISK